MGINQDAYDVWYDLTHGDNPLMEADVFIQKLTYVNTNYNLPVPTKKDQHNGFLRTYIELNPTTQVAIKEYIFAMSDKEYRKSWEKSSKLPILPRPFT